MELKNSFKLILMYIFRVHDFLSFVVIVGIKKILSSPIIILFSIPVIYLSVWYLAPIIIKYDFHKITAIIYDLLGIKSLLSTDVAVISKVTQVISYVLPLSITFFYFSYREQKSLSLSSLSFWNSNTLLFGFFSLLSIAMGTHLKIVLSGLGSNYTTELEQFIKDHHSGRVILWVCFSLYALRSGFLAIKEHVANINISSQLQFALKKFNEAIINLKFSMIQPQRKLHYNKMHQSVESIYQLLFLSIDKNMTKAYVEGVNKWGDAIYNLIEGQDCSKYIITVSLQKKDGLYLELYRSILKNQVTLITKLISSSRLEDGNNAIRIFTNLESKQPEYYTALHELAVICFKQDLLDVVLDNLNSIMIRTKDKNRTNDINLIYKQLLILAIEDSNTSALSKIVYSMLKNIKKSEKQYSDLGIPIPNVHIEDDEKLSECIIYMVLQSLVKSTELSRYSCEGFLIKFLVTNITGELLKTIYGKAVDNLIKNKQYNNPYILSNHISNITVSYNFNESTVRYCFEKMSILIYCQQHYVHENQMNINNSVKIRPFISVNKLNHNIPYLFGKIKNVGDKYGMLFIKDAEFMSKMERKISGEIKLFKQHNFKKISKNNKKTVTLVR